MLYEMIYNLPRYVQIKNNIFNDLTYEYGNYLFYLSASNIEVENVTFKNIGRFNMLKEENIW